MLLEKIISGGQTGADIAGIHAGHNLGFATGGTAPKGWRVCNPDGTDGSNPALKDYGLAEDSRREYQSRTRKNAAEADGTLWVGYEHSGGGKLTQAAAKKAGRPIIINPTPEALNNWLDEHSIRTLNVAGNRYSDLNPDIYERTYNLLAAALNGAAIGKVHYLKTWPKYWLDVQSGQKTFEIRFDDRGFQVGDLLCLQEWDEDSRYSGRELWRKVSYILGNDEKFFALTACHVVMAMVPHTKTPF